MAVKSGGEKVPAPTYILPDEDGILQETAARTVAEVETCFSELALHKALIAIWELISITNKYIVEREPWNLAKDPGRKARLETIIYNLLETLRIVGVLVTRSCRIAEKILRQMVSSIRPDRPWNIRTWGGLAPGGPDARRVALPAHHLQQGGTARGHE